MGTIKVLSMLSSGSRSLLSVLCSEHELSSDEPARSEAVATAPDFRNSRLFVIVLPFIEFNTT